MILMIFFEFYFANTLYNDFYNADISFVSLGNLKK